MTEPGDTTPISDEAVEAFRDGALLELAESIVRAGLAAAAPLLVSAEAERRGDSDELLAAAAHESSEDRRLAALMVEPRNRAVLERRAEVTERLAAEVEGLRAELAEAKARLSHRRERPTRPGRQEPNADAVEMVRRCVIAHLPIDSLEAAYTMADDIVRSVAALRAAGGQALNIVFDGPPGPVSGRFIEVENDAGVGVNAGEWSERPNGWWALRIPAAGGQEKPNGGRADEDGVVFMPEGEAVETGTEWRVFAGGPDPDDCAMSRVVDGEAEAEENAAWIIGGLVACRKVDYGPWQIVPPAAPVGGQAEPSDAQIEAAYSVGYAAMRYDSATWFDSLRKAVPDMLRAAAAGVAAAAVSGEQAQPDGEPR